LCLVIFQYIGVRRTIPSNVRSEKYFTASLRKDLTMRAFFFSNKKLTILIILVVVSIAFPTAIVWIAPDSYDARAEVLFDIILAAASIWIGDIMRKEQAEKHATDKWIPAAESACKALLAMSATIERMRLKQAKACESLEPILSNIPAEKLTPVKTVIKLRCDACSENLSNLRFHIDNSFSDWDAFIETNCDDEVCEGVHRRLDEKRQELAAIMKKDFPAPAPI